VSAWLVDETQGKLEQQRGSAPGRAQH
jgi:hypothetical protein